MSVRVRVSAVLFAGLLLAGMSGCGSSKASVSGKVSFRGKPLAMGTVYMVASDGIQVPASIGEDGSYKIDQIMSGKVRISVNSPKPEPVNSATAARARKGLPAAAATVPSPDLAKWIEIPEKYGDTATSDLTTELKGGENTYNIELQ
jgi:hypothetical protein